MKGRLKMLRLYACGLSVLAVICLSGCATRQELTMVCFTPSPGLAADNSCDLQNEISVHLPFSVAHEDLGYSLRSGELIAWLVVDTADKESTVIDMMQASADFRLISVGYFPRQYRHLFALGDQESARTP